METKFSNHSESEIGKDPTPIGVDAMSEVLEKYRLNQIHKQFFDRLVTLLIASLGFVTALAWDDTLRDIFGRVFGSEETISNKALYALVITFFAAVLSIILGKLFFKSKNNRK